MYILVKADGGFDGFPSWQCPEDPTNALIGGMMVEILAMYTFPLYVIFYLLLAVSIMSDV